MSEHRRRSARDVRRRTLGQNFLTDAVALEFVGSLHLTPDDLVVDVGAGVGALTIPLAATGAEVWAVEPDPVWAERLRIRLGGASNVRVIGIGVERLRLPRVSYRVAANPAFGLTTRLLGFLLDDPVSGPDRADLILQREVAIKHAEQPPRALRTAAWAPWWEFQLGRSIGRDAFRPRPSVDAAVLTIRRRTPPILPRALAPGFHESLRVLWNAEHTRSTRAPRQR